MVALISAEKAKMRKHFMIVDASAKCIREVLSKWAGNSHRRSNRDGGWTYYSYSPTLRL